VAAGTGPRGLQARAVAVGVASTFLLSLCLSGALALAVYVGSLGEREASTLLFYAGLVSLAAGAAYGARQAAALGWAHGAAIGLAYVLISLLLGWVLFAGGGVGGAGLVQRLLLGVAVGAAGGMLGVNL
jgi:putative membrane protein (TIGR04086 family)